ncbi:hypothetical protein [Akkermansia muciniphila]|nr:hypothetical protein [Akkermansia muciniphila]QHV14519.1 hypothetical protein C5O09_09265 [Akkermansia muciniphila]QHV16989.1 hypothetical protein C5O10_09305 [Akkermansia muciniphila]
MADKDYKVQVGVEAKADTRGLDQVNKGLDKVRRTAKQVNEELSDDSAASNLEEVTDAAEETAEALDKTSDAAEGLQEAVSKVGQTARATGDEMDKAGSKGEAAGRKMEKGTRKAAAGLGDLKAKVQATFNIPNELEAAYGRGVAWGQAILDGWEKYIEGVDKAAVKRARELKDRLAREAAAREQAYTDALTNAKRERIYDEEQRKITAINDLYTQRIQLIGQLAVNRTAEVDHVDALRQKELELQRTIVKTREIRGEISKETAAALMADLDASEAKSAAKSRLDRQQIMLDAAIQARDETAKQVQLIKAEQEQAAKSPYAGMTGDGYLTLKDQEEKLGQHHQEAKALLPKVAKWETEKQQLEKRINLLEKTQELNRQQRMNPLLGAEKAIYETERKLQNDRARLERINKEIASASVVIDKDKAQQSERQQVENKIAAIEGYYRANNPLKRYSPDHDGGEAMKVDISNAIKEHETSTIARKERLKNAEDQLKLDESNVTNQQQLLQYQKEINSKEAAIAAAKADQASAVAADERRQKDLAELASQRKGVQERWRKYYDQLTTGQDYKDRETPQLKRLLAEGQHMADAGYMSEQDSARLARMRDEALKGLPRELRAKVKWMVDDMIKGYSRAASGERNLLTPLERKDLEAGRFKGKLDNLDDITPSLPKDGAAAKIVTILKDVAKYGVLNEATVKQLEALSMRINADDAAGQRVVSLVRELVQGELGRILTTMSRPQPARPRRVTPEGRDLDAEDEVRTRIRAGAQAPQPHPQPAPQPATGQGYNAMIGEFARQMFGQGETSGRILDVMQQFLVIARQSASQASQYDARLRKMEQEVATLQSRARFGR